MQYVLYTCALLAHIKRKHSLVIPYRSTVRKIVEYFHKQATCVSYAYSMIVDHYVEFAAVLYCALSAIDEYFNEVKTKRFVQTVDV